MATASGDFSPAHGAVLGNAKTKLFWLAQLLRVLSGSYAAWVLVRIVQWWTDSERVLKNMGLFLAKDLSGLPASARLLAMAMDLAAWLLLLAAVVCCWKSLTYLLKEHTFSHPMARRLTWAGWLGALCQGLTLLIRPLQSALMTAHLPATEQVFKWAFYPQDLLGSMLCGVILCFAYLITWAVDVAEENRGFV
ncbi:hypothetical protein MIZ03_2742 [Rhodoferax lithotrophicus]|uniref:DUF2975 domain-containing protein n=1 Tax=Rhodoferax lithotrophicus TaxID=2798804 RepID=A0ABM7MNJ8_9BURK|nr:hypothetical protein [Rhodoferax sp. MIZ03]BCO27851.1 hypothetical protein MIZ03_2742 [Rhodoferax sp. MIZ03]